MTKKRALLCLVFYALSGGSLLNAQQVQDTVKPESPTVPATYNLLYQLQSRKKVTAAVSEIYSPELQKTVSTTYGGWLTGRLAGLTTAQEIGEPGYDDVAVFLRGQAPFVLIDGTPQSFPSINPEQIESITLLKDAVATAMLGMRGGKGAILITTKKGARNQPQRIEFTAQYGVQRPTRLPNYMKAYDYASLYNEALGNDGVAPRYSQADLDAYKNGTDPIGHPDVDWQKEILKKQAPFSRYDLGIAGGNRSTRYYVGLDYLHQDGLLKEKDFNSYGTNSDYKRYLLRSNIETDINKYITTSLNLLGRIQNSNQPGSTTGGIFTNLENTPNNAYPVLNSDSSLGGNLDYQSNLYGQSVLSGYMPVYERDFKADISIKGNLDVLTKGLWIKALAALNSYQRETINRSKSFAVYKENVVGGVKSYTKYGVTGDQANTNTTNSQNRLFYTELSMGYSKKLSETDHIDAIVVASNDYRRENSQLPYSFSSLGGKVSYDHKETWFVDLTAGWNGTERFPVSKRYGVFPALGIGWDITKAAFLKDKISWLDYLKLRASAGKTGNANVGYYVYNQYYVGGTGYGFGSTVPSSTATLQMGALANPVVTWEKANKISTGIDAALFSNKLSLSIDYFNDNYYDLLQSRNNGSDILGTAYVLENIGKNRYSGLEIDASWQDKKGSVSYFVSPNFTIRGSEVVYNAEPARLYSYMQQTGRPVGQVFGYVADGLFASQAEINAHAFQGGGVVPGDIRYRDLNNDGTIDANDQQAIGTGKALMFYGLSTGLSYKGIDLQVLFQGVANRDIYLARYPFQNNGKGQGYEENFNRWTPANTVNATYPRLWVGSNANNQRVSSYWMVNGDYLRIKNVEIGYSIPHSVTRKAGLTMARVFLNASNLVTFSHLNSRGLDPESYAGGYPVMQTINAGLNIKF